MGAATELEGGWGGGGVGWGKFEKKEEGMRKSEEKGGECGPDLNVEQKLC